jgi:hypothetical protein
MTVAQIILLIVILLIVILLIYFIKNVEEYNISPSYLEEIDLAEKQQQLKINKSQYQKFLKERKLLDKFLVDYNENNGDTNLEFGYDTLKETDEKTLGFCPLGEYYQKQKDLEFSDKPEHLQYCTKCKKCQEKPNWYLGSGCLGDQDSECQFGKLPLDLYLRGHTKNSLFHKALPQHKHKFVEGVNKFSEFNHTH